MSDTDDLSIFEVTQEDLADFKIGSESTDDDHTKKDSKNKEEERSKSVSGENPPLKFNFEVYKSVAKPVEGVPMEEKDIHNSMGISLAPIGDVIPGWYNAGGGNKFFMNEVNAHMKLPVCHQSMYILAQARAASYKNNVNSGKITLPNLWQKMLALPLSAMSTPSPLSTNYLLFVSRRRSNVSPSTTSTCADSPPTRRSTCNSVELPVDLLSADWALILVPACGAQTPMPFAASL